jgi:hypothetical protein
LALEVLDALAAAVPPLEPVDEDDEDPQAAIPTASAPDSANVVRARPGLRDRR